MLLYCCFLPSLSYLPQKILLRFFLIILLPIILLFKNTFVVAQNFHFTINSSAAYFDKPGALEKAGIKNVNCIFKDSRGFMWFGSENGLYRFDGTNILYTHHINDDTSTLANNNVISIIEDDPGNLWIGTLGGGFILNPYSLKCIKLKDANNNFMGYKITFFSSDKKTIWGATDAGLFRYNNEKKILQKVWDGSEKNKNSSHAVTCLCFYGNDTLVLGTLAGIVFLNKENFGYRLVPFYKKGKEIKFITSSVYTDDDGEIWAGTWTYGLLHYNKALNNFSDYRWEKDKSSNMANIVSNVIVIKTGTTKILYVGCNKGMFKIPLLPGTTQPDKKNIFLFAHDEKLPNSISAGVAASFYKDNLDNLWIALSRETGINNVAVTTPLFNKLHVKREGYVQESQQIILGGKKYYCVSNWHGSPALQILDSNLQVVKTFIHVPENDKHPDAGNASSVAVDKYDRLWISSWRGITITDNKFRTIKIINHSNGSDTLSRDKNNYLLISGDSVWIASYKNGIDFISADFKKSGHISQDEYGLNEDLIWKIFKDKLGGVWLLGNAFFHRYNSATHQFKPYTFSIDGTVPSPVDIAEKKDGTFLIATKNGLVHFDPVTEKYNYIRSPLLEKEDNINSVCTDENDNAWFLTSAHLVKHDFKTGNFTLYGKDDGLDVTDELMSIRWIDKNKFLIGQHTSFTLFTPSSSKNNIDPPKVIITNATVNDSSVTITDKALELHLSYYQNRISFNFSAINYVSPEQNNFAYRLKGADTVWTYTYNGFVSYANLAPGSYRFEVKVQNFAGIWSNVQSVPIIITPPFWKTWWFISLVILAIASLFYAVVKYITQRNLKEKILRLQNEQAIEKERNRISRDMHDDLGSGLTKIAILTEVIKTQPSSAEKNINKISETARGLVDNLDEMVWALNPKNDSLDKLAAYLAEYTQQYLEGTGIEAIINLPQILSPAYISEEKRRNIFMTVKEFLNNSVKHSGAKNILLQLSQNLNSFEIILKDDGKGIDETEFAGMGNGLTNMQQRIEDIGGSAKFIFENSNGTQLQILCPV